MIKTSLTRASKNINGVMAHEYEFEGVMLDVYDSARNMLLVIELFEDKDLTPYDKVDMVFQMVFADLDQLQGVSDPFKALSSVLWDACGLDITGEHATEHEAPVMDWKQDASRIQASLLMAYGMEWEQVSRSMTFAGVCDLLSMLLESGQETPFQQAIVYRTSKPPKATKYNHEEVKAFKAKREHFKLVQPDEPAELVQEKEAQANRKLTAILTDLFTR